MSDNFDEMNHRQLHEAIMNSVVVLRAAEAGSSAYAPEQVELARQEQQAIASYLEQVGPQQIRLKDLDTNQLLALIKAS